MKNQKIGKLSLKKETVARLNMSEMSKVIGGDGSIEAYTNKCYVLSNFRTIPPCTISFKFETVNKEVVVIR